MISGVLFQYLYFKRIMVSVQLISCPIWFHPMLPITSENYKTGTRKVHGVIAIRMAVTINFIVVYQITSIS